MNTIVSAPQRRTRFLVFDTETTGLLPKHGYGTPSPPITAYPYITQLSYVIYDMNERKVTETFDSYVRIPSEITISEESVTITGITKEICEKTGRDITEVLCQLYNAYKTCDVLIGHNIDFDEKIILIEMERNRQNIIDKDVNCLSLFNKTTEELKNMERYCTMKKGTALCNILMESYKVGGLPKKKYPKLSELYVKLFNEPEPENLHNSLVDVETTLKCYLKMRHNI